MKNQLSILVFAVFMLAAVSTVSAQGKSGKSEEKGQPKKNNDKAVKKVQSPNSGVIQGAGNGNQNQDKGNHGQNPGKGNNGNANGHKNDNGNNGKNDNINNGKNDNVNHGKNDHAEGYKWDRETFKDRAKIKNKEKVAICHKTSDKNDPGVVINVSSNAAKAHMNHGDVMGPCPAMSTGRFSNAFIEKRNVYYTQLEDTREQVVYSRSILDYAIERLAGSRQQLVVMRTNNTPVADIQKKELVVTELEQNVSLLQTLVNAAATILVNKLQN